MIVISGDLATVMEDRGREEGEVGEEWGEGERKEEVEEGGREKREIQLVESRTPAQVGGGRGRSQKGAGLGQRLWSRQAVGTTGGRGAGERGRWGAG